MISGTTPGIFQHNVHELRHLRNNDTSRRQEILFLDYNNGRFFPDNRWTCHPDPEIPGALFLICREYDNSLLQGQGVRTLICCPEMKLNGLLVAGYRYPERN